jgi:hypothetical protein
MKRRDFLKRTAIGGAALAVVPMSLVASKPKLGFVRDKEFTLTTKNGSWNERAIYPKIDEFWEMGIMNPSDGTTSHLRYSGEKAKYHLLTNVPNKHDKGGYTICRRTHFFNRDNWEHKDRIAVEQMAAIRLDCERVLKSPKNYVYIKEL